jgi:hypothetical protein
MDKYFFFVSSSYAFLSSSMRNLVLVYEYLLAFKFQKWVLSSSACPTWEPTAPPLPTPLPVAPDRRKPSTHAV